MDKRDFMQKSGLGLFGNLAPDRFAPLPITKDETVRFKNAHPTLVRLHTNTGLIGTGETYPFNEANAAVIKDLEWSVHLIFRDWDYSSTMDFSGRKT